MWYEEDRMNCNVKVDSILPTMCLDSIRILEYATRSQVSSMHR